MSENELENADPTALLGGEGMMLMAMLIQNASMVAEALDNLDDTGTNKAPASKLFNLLIGAATAIAEEILEPLAPAAPAAKPATMHVFPKNGGD